MTSPAPHAPSFVGSLASRQSVGLPGHCERCAAVGHVLAHPDLGCGDVGCNSAHDESPASKSTGDSEKSNGPGGSGGSGGSGDGDLVERVAEVLEQAWFLGQTFGADMTDAATYLVDSGVVGPAAPARKPTRHGEPEAPEVVLWLDPTIPDVAPTVFYSQGRQRTLDRLPVHFFWAIHQESVDRPPLGWFYTGTGAHDLAPLFAAMWDLPEVQALRALPASAPRYAEPTLSIMEQAQRALDRLWEEFLAEVRG